jgi:hypothetical protein
MFGHVISKEILTESCFLPIDVGTILKCKLKRLKKWLSQLAYLPITIAVCDNNLFEHRCWFGIDGWVGRFGKSPMEVSSVRASVILQRRGYAND